MSNRKAVILVIANSLKDLRQSQPGYSGGITLGKAIGTLNTAVEAEAINYDEFKRLMVLLDNAYKYRGYQAPRTVTSHAA